MASNPHTPKLLKDKIDLREVICPDHSLLRKQAKQQKTSTNVFVPEDAHAEMQLMLYRPSPTEVYIRMDGEKSLSVWLGLHSSTTALAKLNQVIARLSGPNVSPQLVVRYWMNMDRRCSMRFVSATSLLTQASAFILELQAVLKKSELKRVDYSSWLTSTLASALQMVMEPLPVFSSSSSWFTNETDPHNNSAALSRARKASLCLLPTKHAGRKRKAEEMTISNTNPVQETTSKDSRLSTPSTRRIPRRSPPIPSGKGPFIAYIKRPRLSEEEDTESDEDEEEEQEEGQQEEGERSKTAKDNDEDKKRGAAIKQESTKPSSDKPVTSKTLKSTLITSKGTSRAGPVPIWDVRKLVALIEACESAIPMAT